MTRGCNGRQFKGNRNVSHPRAFNGDRNGIAAREFCAGALRPGKNAGRT